MKARSTGKCISYPPVFIIFTPLKTVLPFAFCASEDIIAKIFLLLSFPPAPQNPRGSRRAGNQSINLERARFLGNVPFTGYNTVQLGQTVPLPGGGWDQALSWAQLSQNL